MAGCQNWNTLEVEEVLRASESGRGGLSDAEAQSRLDQSRPNELQQAKKVSPLAMLLRQFTSLLMLILIAAAVVSVVIGEQVEAIVIMALVILAGVLGFIQEHRAERAMED